MARNSKILGVLLAAILAISALAASTAAGEETLSAYFAPNVGGAETAKIDGSQISVNTFTLGSQTVTCETANLNGQALTSGNLSSAIKLEPAYEKCHAFILGVKKPATFTINGCYYVLTATATYKEEGNQLEYPVDFKIECPAGKQIEVHVYENEKEEKTLCTYDIKAQGPLASVTATEKTNTPTSIDDLVLDLNVSGITVTNTKTVLLCGAVESSTATYKGESTLRATTSKGEYVELQRGLQKRFTFEAGPAVATGEKGTAEITTDKGPVKCTNVHYVGTVAQHLEPDLTIEPSYSGCTAFGLDTDVYFEGCTYTFTLVAGIFGNGEPGGTAVGETHTKGPLHIECPEGTSITIKPTSAGKVVCTISIDPQTPKGEVDTKNMSGAKATEGYVLFTNTITGLIYEVEGSPDTCGKNGVAWLNGELHGTIDVKGFVDKGGTPPATGAQMRFRVTGTLAP